MTSTKALTIRKLLADLKKLEKKHSNIKLILYPDGSGHIEKEELEGQVTATTEILDFHNIRELNKKL